MVNFRDLPGLGGLAVLQPSEASDSQRHVSAGATARQAFARLRARVVVGANDWTVAGRWITEFVLERIFTSTAGDRVLCADELFGKRDPP